MSHELAHALRLLPRVPHGRAAATVRALPWVLPASHLVTGDQLLLRVPTARGAALPLDGTVVAYEAHHEGDAAGSAPWQAQLVGIVSVTDPERGARSAFPPAPRYARHPEATYLRLAPRYAAVHTP
ncbi:hypothetical protein [Streptomyces sp. NBRC 109706]|uniref:hypothetical protein n=1 Tax=Streptomyces sp. NBRC 109706 TaxID=1550035 RepID=UPI000780539E|nr:hypothetical protein [Streptomyces sp. NBRC 109706]